MIWLLFVYAVSCTDLDKKKIVCETVCLQDGDEIGFIYNGNCYCANKRDLSRIPMRLNRNITTNNQEKERSLYGDY